MEKLGKVILVFVSNESISIVDKCCFKDWNNNIILGVMDNLVLG